MKAILINPNDRTITATTYDGNWKSIAPIIKAESGLFDIVRVGETTDLYVDDEGLLVDPNPNGYFRWDDLERFRDTLTLAGCALLLGHDEAVDVDATPEWVAARVRWLRPLPSQQ